MVLPPDTTVVSPKSSKECLASMGCLKPHHTLPQHLVRPRDQIFDEDHCGLICNIKCQDCDAEYIGETARRLGSSRSMAVGLMNTASRYKHPISSPLFLSTSRVQVIPLTRPVQRFCPGEAPSVSRIHEAIYIHLHQPAMNRNRKGYELPSIYRAIVQSRHQN